MGRRTCRTCAKSKNQLTESQTTYYFTYLADVYRLLGRIEDVDLIFRPIQTWLEQGIISTFAIKARRVVALVEYAKGNFSKALEIFKQNLSGSNHMPETLLLAAEFAHSAGHFDEAKQYLYQASSDTKSLGKNYHLACLHYVSFLIHQQATDRHHFQLSSSTFSWSK